MHGNTKSPRALQAALLEGFLEITVEKARQHIAEDFEIHEPESLPFGGWYRGPEGFVRLMHTIGATMPTFKFEMDVLMDDGEQYLIFQGRMSADTPGGHVTMPVMERWRFANDKVADIIVNWHDPKLVADKLAGKA